MIHNNEIVSIEEVLIKSPHYDPFVTRKFIFTNRSTNLKLRVTSLGATIDSCEINKHQIIANTVENDNGADSPWTAHVYGFDTLSLSFDDTPTKHIIYQLTKNNEFIVEGKGFASLLHGFIMTSFFLNLNSVENKPSLTGHYLQIRPSHESVNVYTNANAIFAQFINDVPIALSDCMEDCDIVYNADPPSPPIPNCAIMATLSYGHKAVDILLNIDQWTTAHLKVHIKNGSIAFNPHNMAHFKITYRFRLGGQY